MKKWLILFMVSGGLLILLLLWTDYLCTQGNASEGGKLACDMKKSESIPWCGNCRTFLKGYSCKKCKKEADKEKKGDEEGKPSYIFFEDEVTFGKCPVCDEKLKAVTLVDRQGKCISCGEKPDKKTKTCVKTVYACPEHPEEEFLNSGKCRKEITDEKGKTKKCGEKLIVKYISRAKVIFIYKCVSCGYSSSTPSAGGADCPRCGTKGTLTGEFVCEKSGEFPHVNEKEWKKSHQDK